MGAALRGRAAAGHGGGTCACVAAPCLAPQRRLPSSLAPHANPSHPCSFYTTDFDETDEIFNLEKNPNLPMEELTAMLEELRS